MATVKRVDNVYPKLSFTTFSVRLIPLEGFAYDKCVTTNELNKVINLSV